MDKNSQKTRNRREPFIWLSSLKKKNLTDNILYPEIMKKERIFTITTFIQYYTGGPNQPLGQEKKKMV